MTDRGGPVELPTAGVHRRRRIPLIWIVPIVTGLIALWLAWDTFSKKGPTITVAFDTAAGLTAGQSQLKYKNVVMGTVKTIGVSPDLTKVIVTIETVREAEPLLNDKTIFWVVKPELFAGSITGLETLLSGSYIGMRPAAEPGVAVPGALAGTGVDGTALAPSDTSTGAMPPLPLAAPASRVAAPARRVAAAAACAARAAASSA